MTNTENPAKPCAICEANAKLCDDAAKSHAGGSRSCDFARVEVLQSVGKHIRSSCHHAKPDAQAGGEKKWCAFCRKDNHNDAECWSTRPANWKPEGIVDIRGALLSTPALPAVGAGGTPELDEILSEYPASSDPTCNTAKEVLLEALCKRLQDDLTAALSANAREREVGFEEGKQLSRRVIATAIATIPEDSVISEWLKGCENAIAQLRKEANGGGSLRLSAGD